MAISPGFFNKRELETPAVRQNGNGLSSSSYGTSPASAQQVAAQNAANVASATDAANSAMAVEPVKEGGSKLTVGPNIKLKGVEITDCDTLVVEGLVEATMDSRVIQISERGAFKGSAEIDIAEIHGQFDGNLTVRQKLTIFATGKVTGKIRYGKVVIEEGGQLTGDIQFGAMAHAKAGGSDKAALSAASSI